MRKITDIYEEYKILPNLQMHQLRVAAVIYQICQNINLEIDKNLIVSAGLLHDMGNIIKAKLDYFPEFLEPEGIQYWQKVQNEYFEKYGHNEHEATLMILKELNLNKEILEIVSKIGYPYVKEVVESSNFNIKICAYADFRVSPHSVLSIDGRAEESRKRYEGRKSDVTPEEREIRHKYIQEIEKQIFSHAKINPEDINDESISKIIEGLKNFEI